MTGLITYKMIQYFGKDSKRINHSLKVLGFARTIAAGENYCGQSLKTLEIAAVLHDIGIHEAERIHDSNAAKFQELEGPRVAKSILEGLIKDENVIERVCYLVGHHHSYSMIDGVDYQILIEADFLVNILEENISADAIHSIRQKYFKTKTGIDIISNLYLS